MKNLLIFACLLFLLSCSYAEDSKDAAKRINDAVCTFIYLIELVVGALAAIVIIFMGLKYLMSGDDPEGRSIAKTGIIAAFVGVVIIVITVPVVNIISSGVLGLVDCGYLPSMEKTAQSTVQDQSKQEEGKSDQATISGGEMSDAAKKEIVSAMNGETTGQKTKKPPQITGNVIGDAGVVEEATLNWIIENKGTKDLPEITVITSLSETQHVICTGKADPNTVIHPGGSITVKCFVDFSVETRKSLERLGETGAKEILVDVYATSQKNLIAHSQKMYDLSDLLEKQEISETEKTCKNLKGECRDDDPGTRKITGSTDCPDTCYEIRLETKSADESKAVLEAVIGDVRGKTVDSKADDYVILDPTKSTIAESDTLVSWNIILSSYQNNEWTEYQNSLSPNALKANKYQFSSPGKIRAQLEITLKRGDGTTYAVHDEVIINVQDVADKIDDASNADEGLCLKLLGSCGCSDGMECKPGDKISGISSCVDCCVCTPKPKLEVKLLEAFLEGQPKSTSVTAHVGEKVFFDMSSSDPGKGSVITSWHLDYGDGTPEKVWTSLPDPQATSYTYSKPGKYTVNLYIAVKVGKTETYFGDSWAYATVDVVTDSFFKACSDSKGVCGCASGQVCEEGKEIKGEGICSSCCAKCITAPVVSKAPVSEWPPQAFLKAGLDPGSLEDVESLTVQEGSTVFFGFYATPGFSGGSFNNYRLVFSNLDGNSQDEEYNADKPGLKDHTYNAKGHYLVELKAKTDRWDVTDKVEISVVGDAASKGVFIIPADNWKDVLELVPIAISSKEKYPLLMYGSSTRLMDSIGYFLKEYKPERVIYIGTPPQALIDVVSSAGLADNAMLSRTPDDYFSYWTDYKEIVYVEDNYEDALLASTYASLINSPLVVKGSGRDVDSVFAGKNVICVGNTGRSCTETYDLDGLRRKYIEITRTDKIILADPSDYSSTAYFSKTSIAAPILASAKQELLLTMNQPTTSSVQESIRHWNDVLSKEYKIDLHYLTIMSGPVNIPAIYTPSKMTGKMYTTGKEYDADNDLYANLDDDPYMELAVGRIAASTIMGLTTYVSRAIFYDRVKLGTDSVYMYDAICIGPKNPLSDSCLPMALAIQYNIPGSYQERSTYDGRTFIMLLNHGNSQGIPGLSFTKNHLGNLDNSVVYAFACLTCHYSDEIPMCYYSLDRGAIAYMGHTIESPTGGLSPGAKDFFYKLYSEDKTMGEIFRESTNNDMIRTMDEWHGVTTMLFIGDPTISYGYPLVLPPEQHNINLVSEEENQLTYSMDLPFDDHNWGYEIDIGKHITSVEDITLSSECLTKPLKKGDQMYIGNGMKLLVDVDHGKESDIIRFSHQPMDNTKDGYEVMWKKDSSQVKEECFGRTSIPVTITLKITK